MEEIVKYLNNYGQGHFRIINSGTGELGKITDVTRTKFGFGKDYRIWVEFPFEDGYNSNSFIINEEQLMRLANNEKVNVIAEQPYDKNRYSTVEYSNEVFTDKPRVPKARNSGNADFLTGLAVGSLFREGGMVSKVKNFLNEKVTF